MIDLSIKCKIGESLTPGFNGISFGKYTISPLPSKPQNNFKSELLLTFKDNWNEDQLISNPEKEGEIILTWLSVILNQKIRLDSTRLNNTDILSENKENIFFETQVNFPDEINELYNKLKSLTLTEENNLLEKYVRSCEIYQEALMLSNTLPHFSFFLFVICIECLSNKDYNFYEYLINSMPNKQNVLKEEIQDIYTKFNEDYGLKNNFIQFILSNFEEWKSEFNENEFRNLLASIYKIRSRFTHEGDGMQQYLKLVSGIKSKSVFTKIKNKEIEIIGLDYFSKIVRSALINFLDKQPVLEIDNIPKLALKESSVNLISTAQINRGQIVTSNLIKHRK